MLEDGKLLKKGEYSDELYLVGDLFRQLYEKYNRMESKKHFYKDIEDLTVIEINTILVLGQDEEPKRMSQLAGILGVTSGTPTVTIDRLIAKGYVERIRDVGDRRQVFVTLSDKGREAFTSVINLKDRITENIFGALSEEEIKSAIKIMDILNTRMDHFL